MFFLKYNDGDYLSFLYFFMLILEQKTRILECFKTRKPMNTYSTSIFKDPNIAKHLSYLDDKNQHCVSVNNINLSVLYFFDIFNQRWKTGSSCPVLIKNCTSVLTNSFCNCMVFLVLDETSFKWQSIYIYFMSNKNRILKKSVIVHTILLL